MSHHELHHVNLGLRPLGLRPLGLLPLVLLGGGLATTVVGAVVPRDGLIDLVPERTAYVWHNTSDASTRLAEGYVYEVVDAIVDARFDEFLLQTAEAFGLDQEVLAQAASVRNMVESVGSLVPWRALIQQEFVYSESLDPALSSDYAIPSALLVCRPDPAARDQVVATLSGVFGALAAIGAPFVRYDIHHETQTDGHGPVLYRLRAPMFGEADLLQMGVAGDVVMIGIGGEYFGWAYQLLSSGQGSRLTDAPRFRAAWGDLPADAPSRTWVDMDAFVDGLEDARTMLLEREFAGGALQGLVGDAFDLAAAVDTIATATHCERTPGEGTLVVTETLTRFDPVIASRQPLLAASLATPASSELLDYVPADALSFSMRGQVDLAPLYRQATQHFLNSCDGAEAMLWALDTAQAAVDLSIERDLLTWLGSEHVTVEVPSRRARGQVDSLWLCKLRDPRGGRKVLGRIEAVYNAAAPRLLAAMDSKLREIESPIIPEVTLTAAEGMFPNLREFKVTGIPIPVPMAFTYGVVGDALVLSTSREAIETCMLVAAGEQDGLSERLLVADLVGRDDLTSAHLQPYGRQMREMTQLVGSIGGWARQVMGSDENHSREAKAVAGFVGGLVDRVMGVLELVDFVGDAVVTSESREGGLARYERRVVQLLEPEQRPSYGSRSRPTPTPQPKPKPAPGPDTLTRR